jgi:hypothetical protein
MPALRASPRPEKRETEAAVRQRAQERTAHLPAGGVLHMHDPEVAGPAKGLGIRSVPAVVIDGKLADCCTGRGPDEATLRAAGLAQPI